MTCTLFSINAQAQNSYWLFDSYSYQYDMVAFVSLTVYDEAVENLSDYEVAAFCENECRGVMKVQTLENGGTYGYLRIKSNQLEGEKIVFKACRTETKTVFVGTDTIVFKSEDAIGLPSAPKVLNFVNSTSLVVTALNYTREYGEDNPLFDYAVEGEGLIGVPEISCETNKYSDVGTYPIVVTKGSVENKNVILQNGTLTITKAPLYVTVNDTTRCVGSENPDFTISYKGFKNNEKEDVLLEKPIASTDATIDSPAGTYYIILSGGSATNYELFFTNGILTVQIPVGIGDIEKPNRLSHVYSLDGRIVDVRKSKNPLPKGYYIVNGRIFLMKY